MPAPALTPLGQRIYDEVRPLAYDDAAQSWSLAYLCEAIAAMFDDIYDLFSDRPDGRPGWTIIWDPEECPDFLLDFSAQWFGVEFEPGLTTGQKRIKLAETDGRKSGRPGAIRGAPKPYLTGTRTVTLVERIDGDHRRFLVVTYDVETPDPDAVFAAIMRQKPAGKVFEYRSDPGWSIAQMEAAYAGQGLDDLEGDFTSISDLETEIPT